jgi:Histidine kinase-, DNA gyrase B-, and HSP90-like ATPase
LVSRANRNTFDPHPMPTISLSSSFFTKELQAYSDWRSAFWRELVQNAVDSNGSTKIQITVRPEGEGCVVTFNDNGSGMTRDTLEHVYFVVGETTKSGAGSVGGFGRARVLTCFGHASWRIPLIKGVVLAPERTTRFRRWKRDRTAALWK